ncbi:hypothetical protein [Rufibacter ruber]|nr:hypothetical protein [Rufibacter ruber]
MQPVALRETVAPLSIRCKLSTLVPQLRQMAAQRKAAAQAVYPFIKIAS